MQSGHCVLTLFCQLAMPPPPQNQVQTNIIREKEGVRERAARDHEVRPVGLGGGGGSDLSVLEICLWWCDYGWVRTIFSCFLILPHTVGCCSILEVDIVSSCCQLSGIGEFLSAEKYFSDVFSSHSSTRRHPSADWLILLDPRFNKWTTVSLSYR